ncbi:MAG: chromosomal replication initiator protein DnaA [Parcubacteria group bacterium]|nr:chromosomal replication initiator protein DnaA [Parcubacteria group bacterium]
MNTDELWKAVLGQMELNLSKATFMTWIKPSKLVAKEEGTAVICTPNIFIKEWLQNKFNKQLLEVLRALSPDVKSVRYVIGVPTKTQQIQERMYQEFVSRQENTKDFIDPDINQSTNLNKRYTFDGFVVGPHNELAYSAGMAIIKNLGSLYNPLFIYGGVGLGKTHLLQAVGNSIWTDSKSKRILYIPCERLVTKIVSALQNKTIANLKDEYMTLDLLIIDDIHFIAAKEQTQEVFFSIFNALHNNGKQIILSSDRQPRSIPAVEERLRSRFEGGMIADINPPQFETRLAILKLKSQQKQVEVPQKVLEFIATHVQKNIRELEGALNRVIATMQISQKDISVQDVEKMLTSYLLGPYRRTNTQAVLKSVAEFYGISLTDLVKRSRKKEIVKPRQIAMYLLREETHASYPEIGEKLGGRDHSTVMHAYEKIRNEEENDEVTKQELVLIREKIYTNLSAL